jgi:hypothetical protein
LVDQLTKAWARAALDDTLEDTGAELADRNVTIDQSNTGAQGLDGKPADTDLVALHGASCGDSTHLIVPADAAHQRQATGVIV